jgi:hypothetical protein
MLKAFLIASVDKKEIAMKANENGISFRYAQDGDLVPLFDLDRQVWGDLSANMLQWQSRLGIWPDGVFIAEQAEKMVGVGVAVIFKWDYPEGVYPTWEQATDNGFIRNHDPLKGDTIYGVDFTVVPEAEKVAARLLMEMGNVKKKLGLRYARAGYRAPFMAQYIKEHPRQEINPRVVEKIARQDGLVQNLFFALGFDILACVPDYFSRDEESLGWGIIMDLKS